MWLLDTQSLELENFVDELEAPSYAILSHTWGSEEVTFQQMKEGTKQIENKLGYTKIWNCCKEAAADGFDYAWIDTCCIDKTSSAELSEAINSMYRWYQAARLCYVYLDDVLGTYDLDKSRWFTRGWTLQELLAPSRLTFFNRHWEVIGNKNSLLDRISSSANIPASVLMHGYGDASIAQKMSWAAFRKTTRLEDRAYSLLGIFGVSMPMLYGEGEKAFERLQLEILKTSADQSIFAWTNRYSDRGDRAVLATTPDHFVNCGDIQSGSLDRVTSYEMTNIGLRIELPIIPVSIDGRNLTRRQNRSDEKLFVASLACHRSTNNYTIGILLHETNSGAYIRTRPEILYNCSLPESHRKVVCIQQHLFSGQHFRLSTHNLKRVSR